MCLLKDAKKELRYTPTVPPPKNYWGMGTTGTRKRPPKMNPKQEQNFKVNAFIKKCKDLSFGEKNYQKSLVSSYIYKKLGYNWNYVLI